VSLRRRFRVESLPQDEAALDAAASHHLLRVLRLGPGARVVVFDGGGKQRAVEVVSVEGGIAIVRPDGPVQVAAPDQAAHLLLGQLKPKAHDVAVRMAVEAGITHLHIFAAHRSVKRPARIDRWERLVEAAAQQCGRADLPTLYAHDSLGQALADLPSDLGVWVALPGAEPARVTGPAAAIVGPEGGLTEREVDLALDAGAQPLGLGAWTLRADTAAALASGAICRG